MINVMGASTYIPLVHAEAGKDIVKGLGCSSGMHASGSHC